MTRGTFVIPGVKDTGGYEHFIVQSIPHQAALTGSRTFPLPSRKGKKNYSDSNKQELSVLSFLLSNSLQH